MSPTAPRNPIRPTVLKLIAEAECAAPGDPMSDEDYFLRQLRAAIADGQNAVDRLRDRYGAGRRDGLCRVYARYPD